MWFGGWKVKGQDHRVNKFIFTLMTIAPMSMHIWLTTIRRGFELSGVCACYAGGSHQWTRVWERSITWTSRSTRRTHQHSVQGDRTRQVPRPAAGNEWSCFAVCMLTVADHNGLRRDLMWFLLILLLSVFLAPSVELTARQMTALQSLLSSVFLKMTF